jgi:hypothetical protein
MSYVTPCLKCVPPKRRPGCHSECAEYINWKKAHEKTVKKIRRAKSGGYDIYDSD